MVTFVRRCFRDAKLARFTRYSNIKHFHSINTPMQYTVMFYSFKNEYFQIKVLIFFLFLLLKRYNLARVLIKNVFELLMKMQPMSIT